MLADADEFSFFYFFLMRAFVKEKQKKKFKFIIISGNIACYVFFYELIARSFFSRLYDACVTYL